MIPMDDEYMDRLEAFVDAYLIQKDAMENGNLSDKELTAAVLAYMQASGELREFMSVAFNLDDPDLPNMDVFYSNGKYHDFAYRIYAAVQASGQFPEGADWRTITMVRVGELLRSKCKIEQSI